MRRPLALVVGGLFIVLLDFRTEALDLVPDPVGWLLVAAGAAWSSLPLSAWLASAAAALSVSDAFLPFRTVIVDPVTNRGIAKCPGDVCGVRVEYDPVSGWRLAAVAAALLVGSATVLSLVWGLRRRAHAGGHAAAARRFGLLLVAVGLGWAMPPVLAVLWAVRSENRAYDPIWNGHAEYVALIGWGLMSWLLVELWQRRDTAWATPRWTLTPSPWTQLR